MNLKLILAGMSTGAIVGLVILAILVIILLALIASSFKIVPQAQAFVIEKLGSYHTTWETGFHFLIPFIYRISKRVNLKEQVFDFDPQPVITKDNVTMQIDTVVFFSITDPKLYTYGVDQPIFAIEKLTATTLRNIIGEIDLDGTLTSRDVINSKIRTIIDDATDPWGIKINRVELKNILPPKDIRDAMEKQMRAERDKRAKILEAEGGKQSKILQSEGDKESKINNADGEKQSQILKAEGEAQARIRTAQGEAEAIQKITQAIGATKSDPVNYLLAVRYIDTLGEMVSGKDNKIFYMPYKSKTISNTWNYFE